MTVENVRTFFESSDPFLFKNWLRNGMMIDSESEKFLCLVNKYYDFEPLLFCVFRFVGHQVVDPQEIGTNKLISQRTLCQQYDKSSFYYLLTFQNRIRFENSIRQIWQVL